jgi:hypothetical protein
MHENLIEQSYREAGLTLGRSILQQCVMGGVRGVQVVLVV